MRPETLWHVSRLAHRRGHPRTATCLKALNFVLFHCVLPSEVEVRGPVTLHHHGLGVVLHPDVLFEGAAELAHNVTLGVADDAAFDGTARLVVEDNVSFGAGCVVLVPAGRRVRIGRSAAIGAGAVVVSDVQPGQRVAGARATVVGQVDPG